MSIVNIHPQKTLIICPFLIRITINNSTYAAAVGASVLLLFLILLHDPISGRLATHRSIYVIMRTSVERKEPLIDLPSIAFYKHTSPSPRSVSQSARYKFPTRGVFPSDQFESGKARLRITVQKTEHDNQPSIHVFCTTTTATEPKYQPIRKAPTTAEEQINLGKVTERLNQPQHSST